MVEISKEQWFHMACMVIQDSIKDKKRDIHRYEGLHESLEKSEIVPFDYGVENVVTDLISQSTDHERKLRTMARHIKCEDVAKEE